MDFDEEILRAVEVEQAWPFPADGTRDGFALYEFNNANAAPENGGIDEGFICGASVFSWMDEAAAKMPADTDNVALRF